MWWRSVFAGGLLAVALFGRATAGPSLEDGEAAAQRGDFAMRERIWRSLAENGNADAQFLLAEEYRLGTPHPDDRQAAIWYGKAADQGHIEAEIALGEMYADGDGVSQDYALAHMWFNLAASRTEDAFDHTLAVYGRRAVETKMTPGQIAEAQRMAREWAPK